MARWLALLAAMVWLQPTAAQAGRYTRFYGEAGLWVGAARGERRLRDGTVESLDSAVFDGRLALGIETGPLARLRLRIGGTIDAISADRSGSALGGEAQLDAELNPCWRLGVRGGAAGGAANLPGGGVLFTFGIRARHRYGTVGIDALISRSTKGNGDSYTNGFLVGASLDNRAGKVASGIAGGGLLLYVLVMLAATK